MNKNKKVVEALENSPYARIMGRPGPYVPGFERSYLTQIYHVAPVGPGITTEEGLREFALSLVPGLEPDEIWNLNEDGHYTPRLDFDEIVGYEKDTKEKNKVIIDEYLRDKLHSSEFSQIEKGWTRQLRRRTMIRVYPSIEIAKKLVPTQI